MTPTWLVVLGLGWAAIWAVVGRRHRRLLPYAVICATSPGLVAAWGGLALRWGKPAMLIGIAAITAAGGTVAFLIARHDKRSGQG